MAGDAVAAVLLAGCAGAALPATRASPLGRLHRTDPFHPSNRRPAGRPRAPTWAIAPVAGVAAVALTGRWPVALAAALAALSAVRVVTGRAMARRTAAGREQAIELLGALAGELRGGAPARTALAAAAGSALPEIAAAARSPAANPADALHAAGQGAGGEPLADLAMAWRLVELSGASLAGPVASLTAAARADEAVRRELSAQLAGPRATATLLCALPAAGVLLGAALGAEPLGFLLGTSAGNFCLLAGTVLVAAGLRWTEAIVEAAEQPRRPQPGSRAGHGSPSQPEPPERPIRVRP